MNDEWVKEVAKSNGTPTPSQAILKSHGVTYAQWRILDRLSSGDVLEYIVDVGFHFYDEEFCRNPDRILDLVDAGLVYREKFTFHPCSQRAHVRATPEGTRVAALIRHNMPGDKK